MTDVGRQIGRYRVLEVIGRGGMGVLYRAHDPVLERDVAIKMIESLDPAEPSGRHRLEGEARAVARLQHRNVVTIYELSQADDTPYIVMELLGGRDLQALLRRDPPLTLDQKLDIMIQLCAGLSFAHAQGVVHRDIKPSNVRVLEDGTVKLLDFGIAKFSRAYTSQRGTVTGSIAYMAPEQLSDEPVDGRADLFAAGVLLYELLSGQKPFPGDSPPAVIYQILHGSPRPIRSLLPDLHEQVERIVLRALQKRPDDRYRSASEMASDLQIARTLLPAQPDAPSPPLEAEQAPTVETRRPRATAVADDLAMRPPRSSDPGVDLDIRPRMAADMTRVSATRRRVPLVAGAAIVGLAVVATIGVWAVRMPTLPAVPPVAVREPLPFRPVGAATLTTTPPGAALVLGGEAIGFVTPVAVPINEGRPLQVELRLDGYEPMRVTLTSDDAGRTRDVILTAAGSAQVLITGAYAFEVLQGDRRLSGPSQRHVLRLAAGSTTLRLRNADYYLDTTRTLELEADQMRSISAPGLGTVAVYSNPEDCRISINGRDAGYPPIARLEIAAGRHQIARQCANNPQNESQTVTITEGEAQRVQFRP